MEKFLTEKYGEKVATYHELPFKHHYEGQIFTGSIDFVWETKDGVVLVDFKSYPGSKGDVVNPEEALPLYVRNEVTWKKVNEQH